MMLKITIDGRHVEVAEGGSVLAACRGQGVDVPTMCYLNGHEHYTSCMICVVKDVKQGRLVPSCSAPVTDGMEIETGTEEVLDARRVAVELLLSEHVGDCEGPCRRACPVGIDVPGVIRRLAAGDREGAGVLLLESSAQEGVCCIECTGRCEKPCRRHQVDAAVSIRLLMLFAADSTVQTGRVCEERARRFNSTIGRLTEGEKDLVTRDAAAYGRVDPAQEGTFTAAEAAREALRCLHCDCRKPDSCRLRKYADVYGAKQSRYRAEERTPIEIQRQGTDVVYEPGKCIKCGICVKITEHSDEPFGMAFLYRGYDSMVGVPFGEGIGRGLTRTAAQCIRECPTGALSRARSERDTGASP